MTSGCEPCPARAWIRVGVWRQIDDSILSFWSPAVLTRDALLDFNEYYTFMAANMPLVHKLWHHVNTLDRVLRGSR